MFYICPQKSPQYEKYLRSPDHPLHRLSLVAVMPIWIIAARKFYRFMRTGFPERSLRRRLQTFDLPLPNGFIEQHQLSRLRCPVATYGLTSNPPRHTRMRSSAEPRITRMRGEVRGTFRSIGLRWVARSGLASVR